MKKNAHGRNTISSHCTRLSADDLFCLLSCPELAAASFNGRALTTAPNLCGLDAAVEWVGLTCSACACPEVTVVEPDPTAVRAPTHPIAHTSVRISPARQVRSAVAARHIRYGAF
jgi:hypothetical protein